MIVIPIFIFIVGLIIGSFLNVVIIRLNTGRGVVHGRSSCTSCARVLAWYELIPVLSFIMLRGKCRRCKSEISFQYPIVELITAIIFSMLYGAIVLPTLFSLTVWITYAGACVIAGMLIVIFFYDLRHKIIPDEIMYPLIIMGLIAIVWQSLHIPHLSIITHIFYGVLSALPFFLLWLVAKGKLMGFGDVKLALAIGFLVGIGSAMTTFVLAFWIGGVVGLFLLALTKTYKMKSEIPFAPFLIIALAIVFFSGITLSTFFPFL